jgi:6-phosphogluconolactonase/glucosamine-6-phosphate isomerase/deaminase
VVCDANPTALAAEAAQPLLARIAARGRAAFARSGRFTIAISPAALTAPVVDAFAVAPLADERFWRATHLFLSDSGPAGAVGPRALARRLPIPASALHLEIAEHPNPLRAASYEQELRAFFGLRAGLVPRFDLVVLALGADGRLGGLLPGGRALDEIERLVRADFDLEQGAYVATLTPPVIRRAGAVVVAAPAAAADAVPRRIAATGRDVARAPLELLRAAEGDVTVVAAMAER